jgi:DNA-binding transcriptional LysR family regulator
MIDLNELRIFAEVVGAGGFSAASRRTGIPTSTLSRRVARLEQRLGVQLLYRDSRKFNVTEFGASLHEHCQAMMRAAQTGIEQLHELTGEPSGTIRISCPVVLANIFVGKIAAAFALAQPGVRIVFEATTRPIDPINDHYDVAIQAAFEGLADSQAIARKIGQVGMSIVASPGLMARKGPLRHPEQLADFDGIGFGYADQECSWTLSNADGRRFEHRFRPRFVSDSLLVAKDAAIAGVGIARLSTTICQDDFDRGRLMPLLEDWSMPPITFYALYPPRRSIGSAAIRFVDFLAERFQPERFAAGLLEFEEQFSVDPATALKRQAAPRSVDPAVGG